MNNKKVFLILVLAMAVLLGGAYVLYSQLGNQVQTDRLAEPEDGGAAQEMLTAVPDFTVYDGEGNAVSLSDLTGKPVVLNFWASWCGPCQSEMPDFDAACAEYGQDIHFMMVNMADGATETVETAAAYIEENGYTFPVYYDTASSAAAAYGITAIPTTFFIDAEGNGVAYGQGALNMEALERGISMILPA